MVLTIFLFGAFSHPSRATETVPHAVAVVVARAEIVSGVRVMQPLDSADGDPQNRKMRLPRPRERPCPEADETPCRLFVIDMP